MLLSPGQTVYRLAPGDVVAPADPHAASSSSGARLSLRLGGERAVALEDGEAAIPDIATPDEGVIEWVDGSGEVICRASVEIVAGHYFALDELIAYGDGRDDFDEVPEEGLFMARQVATETFEAAARRSFTRRLGSTRYYGAGFVELAHNDVREMMTDGMRLVSDCQCVPSGDVSGISEIEYAYGLDHVPAPVSRAVLTLAAYLMRPTNRPIGATGESTEAGYIHFTTAGRDGATDVPEVNAAITQYGRAPRCMR